MKPLLIFNDIHIGVKRSAGTTPTSASALRGYLLERLCQLLDSAQDKDLCILGDLFDEFTVETFDLISTFHAFADWLSGGGNLTLVRGNHDWSPKADRVSSFDLLAQLLERMFPEQVTVVKDGATSIGNGIIAVPHMPNQDLFDMALDSVMDRDGQYLLTHCNVLPPACHGRHDHSLSIGEDRARQLSQRFTILNAHEHQHYYHDIGRGIHCLGNQVPSSVADCLAKGHAQADGKKYAYEISDAGITRHEVWDATHHFAQVDWRDLDQPICASVNFVRVEGEARAEEAALVVDAIAKFRSASSAFVVSNAVKVEGHAGVEEAAATTFESLKVFDVMGALLGELAPDERRVIEGVMS